MFVKDKFLENFEEFNEYARGLDYMGAVNPYDEVEYPDISLAVPDEIAQEVRSYCSSKVGQRVKINAIFLRLSKAGTYCPHQSHNDKAMGQYGFILYMQDGPGGTAFVDHVEASMPNGPWTNTEYEIWKRDMNVPSKWTTRRLVDMKANRALFYDSKLMHRAEPIGGFGDTVEDGRLVLTAFLERDVENSGS